MKLPFVLVHGAWHGGWCWQWLVAELAARGHIALAPDLPGHGLDARVPASWLQRPLDAERFRKEPSPVAGIALDDHIARVVQAIEQAAALGAPRVALVGHSMGGLVVQAVAERVPERIAHLVYLAAYMPASGATVLQYLRQPENAGEAIGALVMASPSTGALRIDPRSEDADYQARLKAALYPDLEAQAFQAVAGLMTPDTPAAPFATPLTVTPQRWGAVQRHYIECLQDRVLPLALQRRFIREADAAVPELATRVHSHDGGHSPFIEQPRALAERLVDLVTA